MILGILSYVLGLGVFLGGLAYWPISFLLFPGWDAPRASFRFLFFGHLILVGIGLLLFGAAALTWERDWIMVLIVPYLFGAFTSVVGFVMLVFYFLRRPRGKRAPRKRAR